MDTERQEQQRMGDSMPEGAQLNGREAVSSGLSDLLRGSASVLGGTGGTANTTEIWKDGKEDQGRLHFQPMEKLPRIWLLP